MTKNTTQDKIANLSGDLIHVDVQKNEPNADFPSLAMLESLLEQDFENGAEMTTVKLSDQVGELNDAAPINRDVIQTLEEFKTVQDIWDNFDVDPLNSYSWNLSWWNAYQSEGNLHLIKFEQAGETIGLAPFYVDRWMGLIRFRMLATGDTCTDYVDLICDPAHYERCTYSLAEYIRSNQFDVVELECTKDDRLAQSLKGHLDRNYRFDHRTVEPTWRLPLYDTWDEFKSQAKKSLRRKINKAVRKLESDEFTVTSSNEMPIKEAFETFRDLHTSRFESMGKPGVFADPKFETFLRSAVSDFHRDGTCEIVLASHKGKVIASQLYFVSSNGFQLYQSGYDPDSMKHEPGHLLFTWMVKKAIDRGDSYLDFLRGNEPYKEYWGAEPHDQKKLRMVVKKIVPTVVAKVVETGRNLFRRNLFRRN